MTQPAKTFYTPEEYLALEDKAEHRSEYYQGQIYAMAGGSLNHNFIALNIAGLLNSHFGGKGYRAYSNDVKLLVRPNGLFAYPDVLVICGEPQYAPGRVDTITNPIVIFEVLSDSTANYDRTTKIDLYKEIGTLQTYVLVEQDKSYVQSLERLEGDKWLIKTYRGLNKNFRLGALDLALSLSSIYQSIDLTDKEGSRPGAEDADSAE